MLIHFRVCFKAFSRIPKTKSVFWKKTLKCIPNGNPNGIRPGTPTGNPNGVPAPTGISFGKPCGDSYMDSFNDY